MYLRNTANQRFGFNLVDGSGADVTGATVTVLRALDGGSQQAGTGTVDVLGGGQYRYNLSQADTDAETGMYMFKATGAVSCSTTIPYFTNYDGIATGGTATSIFLQAGFATGANSYVGWRIALVDEAGNVGRAQARVATAFNTATGELTVDRAWDIQPVAGTKYTWSTPADGTILSPAGLDRVVVEAGINARQALSPILAASAGQLSGATPTGGTVVIKGAGVATTRLSVITDANGNRSAVSLSLPS